MQIMQITDRHTNIFAKSLCSKERI